MFLQGEPPSSRENPHSAQTQWTHTWQLCGTLVIVATVDEEELIFVKGSIH